MAHVSLAVIRYNKNNNFIEMFTISEILVVWEYLKKKIVHSGYFTLIQAL